MLKKFHQDETGMEAIQVVMIVAIAAIVLLVVKSLWDTSIKPWMTNQVTTVTGWKN